MSCVLPAVEAIAEDVPAAAGNETPAHEQLAIDPPELWSLEPINRPEPPRVGDAEWIANPIDRFVLAKLEETALTPAPPADRRTLIRRAVFDLWGLPPEPETVRRFVADQSPDAYERLIDRLLAGRHFGERWARYWLDLVRFAETNGYERDATKQHAWKYRDWVIRALNDDMPYDRFVTEQLAGDEVPDATLASLVATGFLRIGTFDDEPNDPLQYKYEQWDDLLHATSTAFMALTLRCARCHSHKYDPISQRDYYAFLNFFTPGKAADGDVLAFTDTGAEAPPIKRLHNGDPRSEQEEVAPGFLTMLPDLSPQIKPPPEGSATTTRRRQLARWLVDERHPLTSRVIVNRLWQHHFGQGLSRSVNNFGIMGQEPTHPELLDWLAAELMDGGWRMKRIHKLILMSSTYRQASAHPNHDDYLRDHPANELWWHYPRRRLDAEALRDAMLTVSGRLNHKAAGPSFFPTVSDEALEGLSKKGDAWGSSPPDERRRRSIYMFSKRSLLSPLMTVFDFHDTTRPCGQRNVTTVAPQALALLNNRFVHEQSTALAARVQSEAGEDPNERITRAWWLALGRAPEAGELQAALAHLKTQQAKFVQIGSKLPSADKADAADQPKENDAKTLALASLCHVLLNLNEFVYID